jgi:hypothetical protein
MSCALVYRPRVIVEYRNATEAEAGRDEFEESLPDAGDANAVRRFAGQRGHREWITIAADIAERFQIGVGVHDHPEATYVLPNRDAEVNEPPASHANTGLLRVGFPSHAVFAEQFERDGLKLFEVRPGSHQT